MCFFEYCLFQGDSDKLIEEIQQLNKSLLDSEAIALDAKKESAFLRSENLELKEKMASTCWTAFIAVPNAVKGLSVSRLVKTISVVEQSSLAFSKYSK